MLSNTHRINNTAAVCFCVHAGGLFQVFRRHAGNLFHIFRSIFGYCRLEKVKPLSAFLHIFLGVKTFRNDHVHQTIENRDIRSRFLAKPDIGKLDQINFPRVNNDELCFVLTDSALDLCCDNGMIFRRIGSCC